MSSKNINLILGIISIIAGVYLMYSFHKRPLLMVFWGVFSFLNAYRSFRDYLKAQE
jgi:uncharacterized membrane protein HdeD (DUF308 family)